jgi:hypothetical protein
MIKKTLVLAALVGGSLFGQVSIGINIGTPPPPPRVVRYQPPAPGPGFFWVAGYWDVNGPRYVWHDGYWQRPPYADGYWVAPRWERGRYFKGYWDHRKVEHHDNGRHKGWDKDRDHDRR